MLAVIKTGGKQYKVKVGDFVSVQKLPYEVGAQVEISDVLMTEDKGKVKVGTPTVAGALVTASVVEQKKLKTVLTMMRIKTKKKIKIKKKLLKIIIIKVLIQIMKLRMLM